MEQLSWGTSGPLPDANLGTEYFGCTYTPIARPTQVKPSYPQVVATLISVAGIVIRPSDAQSGMGLVLV